MEYILYDTVSLDGFLTGKGQCQTYSQMFLYIMNKLDINCMYVNGSFSGQNHGWNHVQLNGKWYVVDISMDDSYYEKYNFFLTGKNSISDRSPAISFPSLSNSDYK